MTQYAVAPPEMARAPVPEDWVTLEDARAAASRTLSRAAWDFLEGGAGQDTGPADAERSFAQLRLVPRILQGVAAPRLDTRILGIDSSMPILVAPMGLQRVFHPLAEEGSAAAAAAAGVPFSIAGLTSAAYQQVKSVQPHCIFQVLPYKDHSLVDRTVDLGLSMGFRAVIFTADIPIVVKRPRDERNRFLPLVGEVPGALAQLGLQSIPFFDACFSWKDLERVVRRVSDAGAPVVLKGILHPADVQQALDVGVSALWVSSHGMRQLDSVTPPLAMLPAIAKAAARRVPVLFDGGARSGADVLKALALGAGAVAVGRPVMWGLAAGGVKGAQRVLEILRQELKEALTLCSMKSPSEATADYLTTCYWTAGRVAGQEDHIEDR